MPEERISIPEDLQSWVVETFGDASTSRAEAYRMALWYARHQYQRETTAAEE